MGDAVVKLLSVKVAEHENTINTKSVNIGPWTGVIFYSHVIYEWSKRQRTY